MITYVDKTADITPEMISGMFVGWPNPPTAQTLIKVMRSSYRGIWALDGRRVVGYINAISDGVLTAFIPWLEVLPEYQGQGIGSELVRRMVAELGDMYSIDLLCDNDLVEFYERQGFFGSTGAALRNYSALQ